MHSRNKFQMISRLKCRSSDKTRVKTDTREVLACCLNSIGHLLEPGVIHREPETDRRLYAKAYAQEGAMRAAFEMFKTFDAQDANDNRKFATSKLPMPVLTIEGDKAMGGALGIQAKIVATNVTSITFSDTGHWLMEQR